MANIDSDLRTIYKNDRFPLSATVADKDMSAFFPDLNLTVVADQFAVDKGDFELFQSICTDEQLKFGKCNVSQVKFTLADVTDAIKGKEFGLTQTVDGEETTYTMPLGYYTVYSAPKQDDLRFKDITAYDRMKKIDVDVSSWYNGLFPIGTESYTLAQLRTSLLTFLGLVEDISRLPLPNDTMTVKKTIDTAQLSGRTVIEACEELNGSFGLIGYDGKFNHIILKPMHHDYPQDDYPESDYPVDEPYDEYLDNYEGIHFEEYRVLPIDKLQIRQEENDIGAIYGTGTNAYVIQGNFLVYGKTAEELQLIAQNASQNIFDRGYRPYEAKGIGLPYIQPGDFIKYNADDTTAGYVFSRTLSGIQSLQDEYKANGSEEQEQNFGINDEIIQIKGRATKIEKSVDGVKIQVTDLEQSTASQFEQTAQSISAEVTRATEAEGTLSGSIEILAGQVVLKVDTSGNIGYIALDADPDTGLTSIDVKADNISLEGLVTVNGNFKVLADGSIETVNGKFSGDITASTFIGGYIESENYVEGVSGLKIDLSLGIIYAESGTSFTSVGAEYSTTINDGYIDTQYITMEAFNAIRSGASHQCYFDLTGFNTDVVNGGVPITSVNKDNYSPAPHTHDYSPTSHNHAGTYATPTDLTNTITAIKFWVNQNFQPLP